MNFAAFFADLDSTLTYGWTEPTLQGQPMPGVLEVLAYLKEQNKPIRVLSNQAGVLWEHYQDEIIRLHPEWKRRDYPTVAQLAAKIGKAMNALGLTDIYIAIWDEKLLELITPVVHKTPNNVYWHETPSVAFRDQVLATAMSLSVSLEDALSEYGVNAKVAHWRTWRKPEPGMILQAAADLGIEDLNTILYCGDMHHEKSNSDLMAAQNAGCQFLKAEEIGDLNAK
jgi:Polynucleotide kinase 3 phosphatase